MNEPPKLDVDYVANLARIELTDEEKQKFSSQLGDVLKYFDKLNAVEVDGVEPTAHAFPRHNVWDEDQPRSGFSSEEALMNAPEKRQDQVVVPKVIEE
ncbi:MAG: Asp-tRNA(Asn)/Glu-tRNA(Gln) amidotransferase GatCAB subunit C [Opitutae bacterium]|nr:Asp-tRNA(Asn)/Glu-tRNA(Gln) amidotransferase GatCAB subunit C [Opitutae bacterium]|tara:strand:+ start:635 stop:928 length:294 start_codon:yes stop_codon:yes gene_type:complete